MFPLPRRGRRSILASSLLATAFALSACGGSSSADGLAADAPLPTEVPPGTQLVIADQGERQQVAMEVSGEGASLTSEYRFATFQGAPSILEAFRAGAVDVAWAGEIMAVQSLVAGDDVQVIAALQTDNSLDFAIAPGVDITTLEGLRGRKIAYAEGTSQQAFALRALEKAGLTVDDVELTPMTLSDFPDALRSGQIDAAPLSEPVFSRYLQTPGASALPDSEVDGLGAGLSYLYSSRSVLADPARAAAVREYVGAYLRAVQWINDHEDEWVQAYFVDSQALSPEAGQRVLAAQGGYFFPELDDSLVEQQQETVDVIDRAGELPRPIDSADAFDRRFNDVVVETVAAVGASHTRN